MAYIRPPNTILAGRALSQNPPATPLDPAGVLQVNIDANIASKTELGVVQIGDNIDITPEGVISVTFPEPPGPCCACKAILVDKDYYVEDDDYYVGVKSNGPTKVYLPKNPDDCIQVIVKVDMGPPIGNRKVTVVAQGSNKIDGSSTVDLTVPYETLCLISQGGNWHKI
jgi:hypothetical protein